MVHLSEEGTNISNAIWTAARLINQHTQELLKAEQKLFVHVQQLLLDV